MLGIRSISHSVSRIRRHGIKQSNKQSIQPEFYKSKSINKVEGVRYPENDVALTSYILSY